MTKDEFIESVDGAPIDLFDVAQRASEVTDDAELREAGEQLLAWMEALEEWLEEHEVELG